MAGEETKKCRLINYLFIWAINVCLNYFRTISIVTGDHIKALKTRNSKMGTLTHREAAFHKNLYCLLIYIMDHPDLTVV